MHKIRKANSARPQGLTLIELLVTIAILAIIVALAVPNYTAYIRKGYRADAQKALMNWANNQEIWRSNHTTFADTVAVPNGIPAPTNDRYTFTIQNRGATTFTLRACASTDDQRKDKQKGVNCGNCIADTANALELDQSGNKTPAECW